MRPRRKKKSWNVSNRSLIQQRHISSLSSTLLLRDNNSATLQKIFFNTFSLFCGTCYRNDWASSFFYFLTLYYKKSVCKVSESKKKKIQTRSIFLFKQLYKKKNQTISLTVSFLRGVRSTYIIFDYIVTDTISVCECARLFCCQSLNEIPQSPNNSRIPQIIITVHTYTQNTIDNGSFLYTKPMPLQWNQ